MTEEHRNKTVELIEVLDEFLEAMDYCSEDNEEELDILAQIFTRVSKQYIELGRSVSKVLISRKKEITEENFFPEIIGDD